MTLPNERLNRWLLPVSLATILGMGALMLGVLFVTSTFHPVAISLADSGGLSALAPASSPRLDFLEASPTPSPTGTPSPTPTPSPTSTAMPTATATPLGTATPTPLCPGVFGYVFVDLNCNGVRNYTDPGLAGAVVTLRRGYDGSIVGSHTTDSDGFFLIYAPALGDYVLCEDAPPGYRASTPECWGISLHDCQRVFISFGECPPYRLYLPLVLRQW
jgi:hypothetical protein